MACGFRLAAWAYKEQLPRTGIIKVSWASYTGCGGITDTSRKLSQGIGRYMLKAVYMEKEEFSDSLKQV